MPQNGRKCKTCEFFHELKIEGVKGCDMFPDSDGFCRRNPESNPSIIIVNADSYWCGEWVKYPIAKEQTTDSVSCIVCGAELLSQECPHCNTCVPDCEKCERVDCKNNTNPDLDIKPSPCAEPQGRQSPPQPGEKAKWTDLPDSHSLKRLQPQPGDQKYMSEMTGSELVEYLHNRTEPMYSGEIHDLANDIKNLLVKPVPAPQPGEGIESDDWPHAQKPAPQPGEKDGGWRCPGCGLTRDSRTNSDNWCWNGELYEHKCSPFTGPDGWFKCTPIEPAPQPGERDWERGEVCSCGNRHTVVKWCSHCGRPPVLLNAPLSPAQVEEVVRDFNDYINGASHFLMVGDAQVSGYLAARAGKENGGK